MTQTNYEKYVTDRARESKRSSQRRYAFWFLFIVAVFAFCLGVLVSHV